MKTFSENNLVVEKYVTFRSESKVLTKLGEEHLRLPQDNRGSGPRFLQNLVPGNWVKCFIHIMYHMDLIMDEVHE